jgi:hypothetical protein
MSDEIDWITQRNIIIVLMANRLRQRRVLETLERDHGHEFTDYDSSYNEGVTSPTPIAKRNEPVTENRETVENEERFFWKFVKDVRRRFFQTSAIETPKTHTVGRVDVPSPTNPPVPSPLPVEKPPPVLTPPPSVIPTRSPAQSPAPAPYVSPAQSPHVLPAPAPDVSPAPAPDVSPAPAPDVSPAQSPDVLPAPAPDVSPAPMHPEPIVIPSPPVVKSAPSHKSESAQSEPDYEEDFEHDVSEGVTSFEPPEESSESDDTPLKLLSKTEYQQLVSKNVDNITNLEELQDYVDLLKELIDWALKSKQNRVSELTAQFPDIKEFLTQHGTHLLGYFKSRTAKLQDFEADIELIIQHIQDQDLYNFFLILRKKIDVIIDELLQILLEIQTNDLEKRSLLQLFAKMEIAFFKELHAMNYVKFVPENTQNSAPKDTTTEPKSREIKLDEASFFDFKNDPELFPFVDAMSKQDTTIPTFQALIIKFVKFVTPLKSSPIYQVLPTSEVIRTLCSPEVTQQYFSQTQLFSKKMQDNIHAITNVIEEVNKVTRDETVRTFCRDWLYIKFSSTLDIFLKLMLVMKHFQELLGVGNKIEMIENKSINTMTTYYQIFISYLMQNVWFVHQLELILQKDDYIKRLPPPPERLIDQLSHVPSNDSTKTLPITPAKPTTDVPSDSSQPQVDISQPESPIVHQELAKRLETYKTVLDTCKNDDNGLQILRGLMELLHQHFRHVNTQQIRQFMTYVNRETIWSQWFPSSYIQEALEYYGKLKLDLMSAMYLRNLIVEQQLKTINYAFENQVNNYSQFEFWKYCVWLFGDFSDNILELLYKHYLPNPVDLPNTKIQFCNNLLMFMTNILIIADQGFGLLSFPLEQVQHNHLDLNELDTIVIYKESEILSKKNQKIICNQTESLLFYLLQTDVETLGFSLWKSFQKDEFVKVFDPFYFRMEQTLTKFCKQYTNKFWIGDNFSKDHSNLIVKNLLKSVQLLLDILKGDTKFHIDCYNLWKNLAYLFTKFGFLFFTQVHKDVLNGHLKDEPQGILTDIFYNLYFIVRETLLVAKNMRLLNLFPESKVKGTTRSIREHNNNELLKLRLPENMDLTQVRTMGLNLIQLLKKCINTNVFDELTILNAESNKVVTRTFHTSTIRSELFLKQHFLIQFFNNKKYHAAMLQRIFDLQVDDSFSTTQYSFQLLYFVYSYFIELFQAKDEALPDQSGYTYLEAYQNLYQILYQSIVLVNNLGFLTEINSELPVATQLRLDLSEATNDCISGHCKDSAELCISKECDVVDCEAKIYPTLEGEAEQAHGLWSHSNVPQISVGDTHSFQFFAGSPESNNISEIPVEVVNGMGGPSNELNSVSGLTSSVQNPQSNVGLQLSELSGTNVPLHQNIEINRIIFLDVLP